MASGLPLIASDSGCYSEIVKDGYNGILCAVEDLFDAGFQALKKLSTDRELADSMGRNARSYSVSKLSREKVLSNFIAVLEDRSDAIDNDLSFLLEQPTAA
jgi:glycosyltransferase involved in cell wall biosynthesis